MSKKKTHEEFINEFKNKNVHSTDLEILSKYEGKYTKMSVRCLLCNNIFTVRADHLMSISACPKCTQEIKNKKQTLTHEEFINRVSKDNNFEYLTEYKNMRTKMKVKCLDCGNIFETSPQCIGRGTKCPYCTKSNWNKEQRLSQEEFNSRLGDFEALEEYTTGRSLIHVKCKKCGTVKYVQARSIPNLSCLNCNYGSSKAETEIYNFIKENYSGEIIRNSRNILHNMELDIYIPEFKLAIEYDSFYYHNDKVVDKNYHKNKTLKCADLGISLIHIFENEWRDKQDIVKSKILYKLNKIQNKVYARNCVIKEVDTKDKNIFLDKNHIQGHDTCYKSYGLYFKDNLVSVLTISKPRVIYGRSSEYYELSRFATDINYNVIGAYSKLLKYMFNDTKFKAIMTYADLRYSSLDNLYSNSDLVSITTPNYYYYFKGKLYHRYNFTKYRIKQRFKDIYSDDKTEFEMMDELGAQRIYDCGNAKYIIYNKN